MDTLTIPLGTQGEKLKVAADEWQDRFAVEFDLPLDGRVIAREHIPGLIEWLQGFLEETKPTLPTLPHSVIRATVTTPQGQTQNVVLSDANSGSGVRWTSTPESVGGSFWFEDGDIVSFEVLFPGVEA